MTMRGPDDLDYGDPDYIDPNAEAAVRPRPLALRLVDGIVIALFFAPLALAAMGGRVAGAHRVAQADLEPVDEIPGPVARLEVEHERFAGLCALVGSLAAQPPRQPSAQ